MGTVPDTLIYKASDKCVSGTLSCVRYTFESIVFQPDSLTMLTFPLLLIKEAQYFNNGVK